MKVPRYSKEELRKKRPHTWAGSSTPVVRLPRMKWNTNTCNGNGYRLLTINWIWNRKRHHKILYKQILGNGDTGERCQ